MIESRLEPWDDGTGGGYGNYPGLTVAQVADRFRVLAEEGHNRSVRAILRIVHEQTLARGTLQAPAIVAGFCAVVGVAMIVGRPFVDEDVRQKLARYAAIALGMALLFGIGAVSVNRTASRNAKQVREIRRLALLALERVVESPGFHAKPLEREHVRALDETKRSDPARWEKVAQALFEASPRP